MKRKLLAAAMAFAVLFSLSAQGVKGGGGADSGSGSGSGSGSTGGSRGAVSSDRSQAQRPDPGFDSSEALRTMERLHLDAQERERIRDMLKEQDGELLQIRAELREMQARMTRLMLAERVDRPEIEQTLRRSMELELRTRMIQVDRHVRIKEMLGAERWASLYRMAQMAEVAERTGKLEDFLSKVKDPAQTRLLLQLLRDLR